MLSRTFYDSGSVLTMGDFKTYAGEVLSGNPNNDVDVALVPEFSLQHIKKKWTLSDLKELTKEYPKNLKTDLSLELKSMKWTADLDQYSQKYNEIKKLISKGEIKKAVPFLTFKINKPKDFNQKYLPQILNHLICHKPESEYIYGFWNPTNGFLGCTPEFLIQKQKSNLQNTSSDQKNIPDINVQTMALAGTLPALSPINMLSDIKLKEEHQFVMDDITEKLPNLNLKWSDPKEKIYGLVKHIYATASFKDLNSVESLIQKLSPTSALGVYPKDKLKDLKDLLDVDLRGSYGAPFGYIFKDQFNIVVALRGLFWDDKSISIHVGGGVTDKSDYQKELDELNLKFLSTKTKLGL